MSAYALFITRNDIIKQTPLQGAIDADKLLPFMRTAQDKYMLNLLGTVLFDKLQDVLNTFLLVVYLLKVRVHSNINQKVQYHQVKTK